MAAIFKNVAGTVIAIGTSDNESSPETGVLRIEGAGSVQLSSVNHIIVHNFTVRNSVAYRSTPTIGGPNYIFAFGDNVSAISVQTTMFQGYGCLSDEQGKDLNGILSSFRFYANNRIMPAVTPLIKIVYGGVNIVGFLVGFQPSSEGGGPSAIHRGTFELIGWVDEPWFSRDQGVGSGASSADTGGVGDSGQETQVPPKTDTPNTDDSDQSGPSGQPESDVSDRLSVPTPEDVENLRTVAQDESDRYNRDLLDLLKSVWSSQINQEQYDKKLADLQSSYGNPPAIDRFDHFLTRNYERYGFI